jgi:hypothetical protein
MSPGGPKETQNASYLLIVSSVPEYPSASSITIVAKVGPIVIVLGGVVVTVNGPGVGICGGEVAVAVRVERRSAVPQVIGLVEPKSDTNVRVSICGINALLCGACSGRSVGISSVLRGKVWILAYSVNRFVSCESELPTKDGLPYRLAERMAPEPVK